MQPNRQTMNRLRLCPLAPFSDFDASAHFYVYVPNFYHESRSREDVGEFGDWNNDFGDGATPMSEGIYHIFRVRDTGDGVAQAEWLLHRVYIWFGKVGPVFLSSCITQVPF